MSDRQADAEPVTVSRGSLRSLRSLLIGTLAGCLVTGVSFLVFSTRQADTNDRLDRVIERNDADADRELALTCINSHQRYQLFVDLAEGLTEAGASVGTDAHLALLDATPEQKHAAHELIEQLLPAEVQPLIDEYPPPACDKEAAQRDLERADRVLADQ